jgi:hypothetical protein
VHLRDNLPHTLAAGKANFWSQLQPQITNFFYEQQFLAPTNLILFADIAMTSGGEPYHIVKEIPISAEPFCDNLSYL